MLFCENAVPRRTIFCGLRKAVALVAMMTTCFVAGSGTANAQSQTDMPPVIVGNDRGGFLLERLETLAALRRTGQAVHVTGNICYSTCTMYLGLSSTCISPQTTFGFHGPSSFGRPLEPELFEWASQTMADHYPAGLREWFMSTGRHEITGLYEFSGNDVIRFGVPACQGNS